MYDQSDNESVSFRSELSTTVSTMNDYYARQAANDTADDDPHSNASQSHAQTQQPQQHRASSSASVHSSMVSVASPPAAHTQSLPRPKSRTGRKRSGRRSGRNSRRSSRNVSLDRQSTVSLQDLNSNPSGTPTKSGGVSGRMKQQHQGSFSF